jgi:hypothetical protein
VKYSELGVTFMQLGAYVIDTILEKSYDYFFINVPIPFVSKWAIFFSAKMLYVKIKGMTLVRQRSQRPLPCARRCKPSGFTRWWTRK